MKKSANITVWILLIVVVAAAGLAIFFGVNVGSQAVRYESFAGPGGFLEHLGNKGFIYRNEGIRELKRFGSRLLGAEEPPAQDGEQTSPASP